MSNTNYYLRQHLNSGAVADKPSLEFRKYLNEMEEYYSQQAAILEKIDDQSAEKRMSLFCRHLIEKMDKLEI